MNLPEWNEDKSVGDERIERILDWAEDHPDFDTRFVEELDEKLERFGKLTEAQSDALDNIIAKWGIE